MKLQKGFTVGAMLIVGAILMFLLFLPAFAVRFSTLGEGDHTGFITAVDQRGIFFKNYQIYFKSDNSSSQEDLYCVHQSDSNLAKQLKQASKDRTLVTIHYKGVRGIGWGLCNDAQILNITKGGE